MTTTFSNYPLQWPEGWKRFAPTARASARFRSRNSSSVSVAAATQRVRDELGRMGVSPDDSVISTNLVLNLSGSPRSDQREPSDPGAAVYWVDHRNGGATRCMAIDRYDRAADNLAAIAATLDAMRAIDRHGGAEILDRAFRGFTAIEGPTGRPWHVVLGVKPTAAESEVRASFQIRRSLAHPDKGGNADDFAEVWSAWDSFLKERGLCE